MCWYPFWNSNNIKQNLYVLIPFIETAKRWKELQQKWSEKKIFLLFWFFVSLKIVNEELWTWFVCWSMEKMSPARGCKKICYTKHKDKETVLVSIFFYYIRLYALHFSCFIHNFDLLTAIHMLAIQLVAIIRQIYLIKCITLIYLSKRNIF